MQVLLAIADADELGRVRFALEREGFIVATARTRSGAIARARVQRPAVALVDELLPGGSGADLLVDLRDNDPSVYLMLTGSGNEAERVRCFVDGADDYIVAPLAPREVAARVIALARRRKVVVTPVLDFGRLHIDPVRREVLVDGCVVELPPRELDVLIHLASSPRCTFSRDQLLRDVWDSSADWQDASTVTEHVRRLRQKIEIDPLDPQWLVTIRGVGYRFEPGFADQRGAAVLSLA